MELVTKKGTTVFSTDEHPRGGQATIESLNKLKVPRATDTQRTETSFIIQRLDL